ncbi:major facilitator superfamily-domain-containing protein [Mycena filopes]|nr:major facilitator superfamily-domain-containing protein [Mycena filopes]
MSPTLDVLVVATVVGATTLNTFLSGALTIALPTIGKDLQLDEANLQWPLTVFSLSYGCTLLLFGRIGDILGGRFVFLVGSAWFSVWSIAVALAPNLASLACFMAMLGLGAAANSPTGVSILMSHFPPGPRQNYAFGALGAGQPLGYILGLVLGKIIDSRIGWRGFFYVQAGVGLLFVCLGFICLRTEPVGSIRRYAKGLDWGGAFLSTAGISLLTYGLAAAPSAPGGWGSPHIIASLCASVVILLIFWFYEKWREQISASVLMPPSIWTKAGARMPATISVVFFAWWNFDALLYVCALYFQQVNGLSPLQTSVHYIPSILFGICNNLIGGWLLNRVAGFPIILAAISMNLVAALLFALLDVHASFWKSAFWVLILLAGSDVVYPACTLLVLSAFSDDSKSLAGAIFTVATRLGLSIGVAVTSSINTAASQKYHSAHRDLAENSPEVLMAGFRVGAWSLCGAAGLSFVIALLGLRGIGIIGERAAETEKTGLDLDVTEKVGPIDPTSVESLSKEGVQVVATVEV